jgi:hypothetical protein
MCEHVRVAMREGALGVGASHIYMPDSYADTAELKALAGTCAVKRAGCSKPWTKPSRSPTERIALIGFRRAALKSLTGKTLAEVASARGHTPIDTLIDLVIEDPPPDESSGREFPAARAGKARRGGTSRTWRFRPRPRRGPRHVQRAPPPRQRGGARSGERGYRVAGWSADTSPAGAGCSRSGLERKR